MTELVAEAFVNVGFWVARCPRPDCHAAEYFGLVDTELFGRRLGGLGLDRYVCLAGCGGSFAARWPAPGMRAGIEQLLALRPDPANRNWLPGESLHDLLLENAAHGIGSPQHMLDDPDRDGVLLRIDGDVITYGGRAIYGRGALAELTERGQ